MLIVATSAGGAFAVVGSCLVMAGELNIAAVDANGFVLPTTWQDWAGFGGFIGLTLFGSIIQFCCTAGSGGSGNKEGYSLL